MIFPEHSSLPPRGTLPTSGQLPADRGPWQLNSAADLCGIPSIKDGLTNWIVDISHLPTAFFFYGIGVCYNHLGNRYFWGTPQGQNLTRRSSLPQALLTYLMRIWPQIDTFLGLISNLGLLVRKNITQLLFKNIFSTLQTFLLGKNNFFQSMKCLNNNNNNTRNLYCAVPIQQNMKKTPPPLIS